MDYFCLFFNVLYFIFIFSWSCCVACGVLVPWPRIEPAPLELEGWILNHWTGEVLGIIFKVGELDHKESWAPKNWSSRTVVLEKTLESSLASKEIQPVNPKGNQPCVFTGRTDAEAPILWPSDVNSGLGVRSGLWLSPGPLFSMCLYSLIFLFYKISILNSAGN